MAVATVAGVTVEFLSRVDLVEEGFTEVIKQVPWQEVEIM
jgi:hypothetical protein